MGTLKCTGSFQSKYSNYSHITVHIYITLKYHITHLSYSQLDISLIRYFTRYIAKNFILIKLHGPPYCYASVQCIAKNSKMKSNTLSFLVILSIFGCNWCMWKRFKKQARNVLPGSSSGAGRDAPVNLPVAGETASTSVAEYEYEASSAMQYVKEFVAKNQHRYLRNFYKYAPPPLNLQPSVQVLREAYDAYMEAPSNETWGTVLSSLDLTLARGVQLAKMSRTSYYEHAELAYIIGMLSKMHVDGSQVSATIKARSSRQVTEMNGALKEDDVAMLASLCYKLVKDIYGDVEMKPLYVATTAREYVVKFVGENQRRYLTEFYKYAQPPLSWEPCVYKLRQAYDVYVEVATPHNKDQLMSCLGETLARGVQLACMERTLWGEDAELGYIIGMLATISEQRFLVSDEIYAEAFPKVKIIQDNLIPNQPAHLDMLCRLLLDIYSEHHT